MEKEFTEAYTKYIETIPGSEGPKTEIGWRLRGCYRELLRFAFSSALQLVTIW